MNPQQTLESVPEEKGDLFAQAIATLKSTVEIKEFAQQIKIISEDLALHPGERCRKIAQKAEGILAE